MPTIFDDLQAEMTRAEDREAALDALHTILGKAEEECDDTCGERYPRPGLDDAPVYVTSDATTKFVRLASLALYVARKAVYVDLVAAKAHAAWAENAYYECRTGAMRAVCDAVIAGQFERLAWMLDEMGATIEIVVDEMRGHRGEGYAVPTDEQVEAADWLVAA